MSEQDKLNADLIRAVEVDGDPAMVRQLLSQGASASVRNAASGIYMLEMAVSRADTSSYLEIAQLLLANTRHAKLVAYVFTQVMVANCLSRVRGRPPNPMTNTLTRWAGPSLKL